MNFDTPKLQSETGPWALFQFLLQDSFFYNFKCLTRGKLKSEIVLLRIQILAPPIFTGYRDTVAVDDKKREAFYVKFPWTT